jgi:ribosomal protein L20A (L18A)
MDPDQIKLQDLSKSFEYTKASIEIDSIEEIEHLRDIAKSYIKLYLKQQEVIKDIANIKL